MVRPDPTLRDLSDFQGNYNRVSSLDELHRLLDVLHDAGPIAFDVETGYSGPDRKKAALDVYYPHQFVVGFSLTNSTDWARYVPLKHDFADNLDPNEVWPIMKPFLEESTVVAHNWVFEARNLRALDVKGDGPRIDLPWSRAQDTMLQSYVLSETERHGLKDLTLRRYLYDQAHIDSLFDKKRTAAQMDALRFNTLDVSAAVVNYVCDDVVWALRLDADLRGRVETERGRVYALEREIMGTLLDMAETGIAVDWAGIDTDLGRFDFFYSQMEHRTRTLFQEAVGRDLSALNFRSPIQMRALLFDDMGLHSTRMTKPNKDGEQSLSTDETALEALRHQHPAVDQLLKYRQTKKMGEWFQLWAGLRTSVDDRVHPSLNQIKVQSGRFASDAPNVQNITKKWFFTTLDRDDEQFPDTKDGTKAWEAHVAKVGSQGIDYWSGNARDFLVASPGYTLLSFDYNAAEMRVLAGLTGEPYLINAFRDGTDVHAVAASLAFKVPLDQIGKDHPLRQRAKTVQFGLVYGQGPGGLADGLGISIDEAKAIMEQYFSAFSKVDQWFAKVKREGGEKGYVESWFGRKSTLWDSYSPHKAIQSKAERMMVNIPVQGGAADYCKIAMIRAQRMLTRQGWWGDQVRLLMNQHDSLVFEVHHSLDLHEVRDLLQPCVSFPLPAFPKMEVDWEHGQRWGSVSALTDAPAAAPAPLPTPEPAPNREIDLAMEVVLRFEQKPTLVEAHRLAEVLASHPGDRKVLLSFPGREMPTRSTVTADPDTLADLGRLCTVELRQIA